MEEENRIEMMMDALSTGIKDNTVNVSALIELLADKGLITMKEYQKYRRQENKKMDTMIQKAMNELEDYLQKEMKSPKIKDVDEVQQEVDNLLKQFGGKLGQGGDA